MSIKFEATDPTFAAYFRYREVDGHILVTSLAGDHVFLTAPEFENYIAGRVEEGTDLYHRLASRNLLQATLNQENLEHTLDLKKSFLDFGPNLHIVEVTLRCNETCSYCHSSRADLGAAEKDMDEQTAQQVVDLIFESTSPSLTIEFQGGEPLANFSAVRHVIECALSKNQQAGKTLQFSLVSNLAMMDEEKLAFLLEHNVQICTSIDGPALLHNRHRRLAGGDAFQAATEWVKKINQGYADAGLDPEIYHAEGLLTVTRDALGEPRAIVDTYVGLGFRALFLRPLDPFGFASKTSSKLGFGPEEYLDFYRAAVDYMIQRNQEGDQILERYAAILLTKILSGEDPNFLDLRSPCGGGIGQVAYGHDGSIFTCDEARMLHHMGDDFFRVGHVNESSYRDIMRHDTVRAVTIASNLDGNADCAECVYNPYCGICPVYNYSTQGSLHGQMRTSGWCAMLMGIQDYLFTKLRRGDPEEMKVLERWTTVRPRDHYLHLGGSSC